MLEQALAEALEALRSGAVSRAEELLDAVQRARSLGARPTTSRPEDLPEPRTAEEAARLGRWLALSDGPADLAPEGPTPLVPLGSWNLSRPLGEGAMGAVYLARHHLGTPTVAVKVLRDVQGSGRLEREARAVAELDHPAIVRLVDTGVVGPIAASMSGGMLSAGQPWLAMEYASGGTLVERRESLDADGMLDVLEALCRALAHAHARDILHLDVKPANVVVAGGELKLCDFGLAVLLQDAPEGGRIAGSPAFMAPEQCRGDWRSFGPATDLYGLGCLAAWLVQGRPPFARTSGRDYLEAHQHAPLPPLEPTLPIPVGLETWIRRCLEKDPNHRFRSAAHAALALRNLDQPLVRPSPSPFSAPPVPVVHAQRATPLLGRSMEQEALWNLLEKVVDDGRARRAEVSGDPGLGRTALLRWLFSRAREEGLSATIWIEGRLGLEEGFRECLRTVFRTRGLVGSRLLAHLASRMNVPVGSPLPALVARGLEGGPIRGTGLMLLGHMLRRSPALLVIDDLAEQDRAWVDAQIVDGPLLMLIGTAADPEGRPGWTDIPLKPLGDEAVMRLLHEGFGLTSALSHRLTPRLGGNPSFALDQVRRWSDRAWLASGPRGLDLTVPLDVAFAPDSDTLPWEAQMASAQELQGLEATAHLGLAVTREECLAVLAELGVPASAEFEHLVVHERLVHRTPTGWAFATPRTREVLLVRAREAGRSTRIHEACARVLQRLGAPPARVGRHWLSAGHLPEAAEALLDSAGRLLASADVPAAEQDLRLLDEIPVLSSQADLKKRVLEVRLADELRQAERTVELARALLGEDLEPTSRIWTLICKSRESSVLNAHDDALAATAEALELSRSIDDLELQARVRWNRAFAHRYAGDLESYRRFLDEAIEHWDAAGTPLGLAMAERGRGSGAMARGHFREAAERFERAAAAFQQVPRPRDATQAHHLASACWRWCSEPEAAWNHSLACATLADADRAAQYRPSLVSCAWARGDRHSAEIEVEATVLQLAKPGRAHIDSAVLALLQLLFEAGTATDERIAAQLAAIDAAEGLLHPADVAWHLEQAAEVAESAGALVRAEQLGARSATQWEVAAAPDRAAEIRSRLRT